MSRSAATRLAAALGFTAVALGAFGAHGLKAVLVEQGTVSIWETAVLYHLAHAVAVFAASTRDPLPRLVLWLWIAGVVVFSGSLYALALTGVRWLGAVTPFGGVCFLIGWLVFVIRGR